MEDKRSSRIIMTNEARVLKDLRLETGLSMRRAGAVIGKSDSYIAHLETGRMDVPTGERLDVLLGIYGGMKPKSFYERVRKHKLSTTPKDEILELLQRGSEDQLRTLLAVVKGIIGGALDRRTSTAKG